MPLAWTQTNPMLAVEHLQVSLEVNTTEYLDFKHLLDHLATLPKIHSRAQKLRIRLVFTDETFEASRSAMATHYEGKVQSAARQLQWDHPVRKQLLVIRPRRSDTTNDDEDIASGPGMKEHKQESPSTTTPVAVSPEATTAVTAPADQSADRASTFPLMPQSTMKSALNTFCPSQFAVWTLIRPALDEARRLISWHCDANHQPAQTMQHLQITLDASTEDALGLELTLACLMVLPLMFPALLFLRLRIDFAREILNGAHVPIVARWLYRRLYRALDSMQWTKRVEVQVAVNDQEAQGNYEAFDADMERRVDAATALLNRRGAWEPVLTIASNTRRADLQAQHGSRATHAAASPSEQTGSASTQHRRPLYPGYGFLHGNEVTHVANLGLVMYQAGQSIPAAIPGPQADRLLYNFCDEDGQLPDQSFVSSSHVPGLTAGMSNFRRPPGDQPEVKTKPKNSRRQVKADARMARSLQEQEWNVDLPSPVDQNDMELDRAKTARPEQARSEVPPNLTQQTIKDLHDQDVENVRQEANYPVDIQKAARMEQEEHRRMLVEEEEDFDEETEMLATQTVLHAQLAIRTRPVGGGRALPRSSQLTIRTRTPTRARTPDAEAVALPSPQEDQQELLNDESKTTVLPFRGK